MKKVIAIAACLSVLVLAGASEAFAHGPHHRGPGRGPVHPQARWHNHYRGPVCRTPAYVPRPRVAAYPVYPAPVYPVAPVYPRVGFGLGGPNFSFWYQY